eukprot:GAHX01001858.1.p2 GENE.GAHX01001858.1~~GAHX01001858.1.p2  ORF type:complete len:66 (-),score=1.84 GAHX01001858.1:13-210(-)
MIRFICCNEGLFLHVRRLLEQNPREINNPSQNSRNIKKVYLIKNNTLLKLKQGKIKSYNRNISYK